MPLSVQPLQNQGKISGVATLPRPQPLSVKKLPVQPALSVARPAIQQPISVQPLSNQPKLNPQIMQSTGQGDGGLEPYSPNGALSSDNRAKLNDVVHRMVQAGENDEAIQTAVNQFKTKYAQSGAVQKEPEGEKGVKGFALGATKGGFSTLNNISNLGQTVLSQTAGRVANLLTGKGFTLTEKKLIPKENLEAHGTAEKVGKTSEQIAEFFIPGGAASKATKSLEGGIEGLNLVPKLGKTGKVVEGALKLLGKSLVGAAEAGGVTAVQSGGDKEQTKNAALTGAALPILGKVLSPLAKQITERLPKRLVQSVIGQSKAEIRAGKDVADYVLQSKKIGTADKLINDSKEAVKSLSTKIQDILENVAPKTVRILKNDVLGHVVKGINEAGGDVTTKEVSEIIANLAPQVKKLLNRQSLSLPEANKLRQALDQTLGDRGFLTSQLPFNKNILKSFDDVLREKVKTLAPEGTRDLFEELSKEITLRNSLIGKYAVTNRNLPLNGFDLLLGGGGFAGGGLPGALTAIATKKIVQSPLTRTGAAQVLYQGGKAVKKALPVLGPATRAAVVKGVSSNSQ